MLETQKYKIREVWAVATMIKGKPYINIQDMHGWKTGARRSIEKHHAQGRTSEFKIIKCEIRYKK